jgi:hypothetical protein
LELSPLPEHARVLKDRPAHPQAVFLAASRSAVKIEMAAANAGEAGRTLFQVRQRIVAAL